jgi:hypothetical protein
VSSPTESVQHTTLIHTNNVQRRRGGSHLLDDDTSPRRVYFVRFSEQLNVIVSVRCSTFHVLLSLTQLSCACLRNDFAGSNKLCYFNTSGRAAALAGTKIQHRVFFPSRSTDQLSASGILLQIRTGPPMPSSQLIMFGTDAPTTIRDR